MINVERYSFIENIDKTQIIDDSAELQDILDCGGSLILDIKNPDEQNIYVLYVDTGNLKMAKVEL